MRIVSERAETGASRARALSRLRPDVLPAHEKGTAGVSGNAAVDRAGASRQSRTVSYSLSIRICQYSGGHSAQCEITSSEY